MQAESKPELDIENHDALRNFLVRSGRLEAREEVSFRTLSGGVSKRAVWVELVSRRDAWVIKQASEKLRVESDWRCDAARIEREALGIRHLSTLAPDAITPLIFQNKKFHLLAVRAAPRPHENWKDVLLQGIVNLEVVRAFGKLLGTIHRESWRRRAELEPIFADQSFFEALRIEPYYEYSAHQEKNAAPFLNALIEQTRAMRLALVHSDYRPQNISIYGGQIFLIDHEAIHWGDPAFDAGFALAHFLGKAHHLVSQRAEFLDAASVFWKEYRAGVRTLSWSYGLEARCVRHALACLLAHAVGRASLESLSAGEKARQCSVAVMLMRNAPRTMDELFAQLGARLARV